MIFFLILFAIYGSDLVTKIWVRRAMPLGSEIPILPFFSLSHVNNTGIAFGLFQQMNHVFSVLGILVVLVMILFSYRTYQKDRFVSLVLAVVLGGALGNLTDRLVYGHVTDFLDFYIGSFHWPVFNVADSSICVGAALLVWRNFRPRNEN